MRLIHTLLIALLAAAACGQAAARPVAGSISLRGRALKEADPCDTIWLSMSSVNVVPSSASSKGSSTGTVRVSNVGSRAVTLGTSRVQINVGDAAATIGTLACPSNTLAGQRAMVCSFTTQLGSVAAATASRVTAYVQPSGSSARCFAPSPLTVRASSTPSPVVGASSFDGGSSSSEASDDDFFSASSDSTSSSNGNRATAFAAVIGDNGAGGTRTSTTTGKNSAHSEATAWVTADDSRAWSVATSSSGRRL